MRALKQLNSTFAERKICSTRFHDGVDVILRIIRLYCSFILEKSLQSYIHPEPTVRRQPSLFWKGAQLHKQSQHACDAQGFQHSLGCSSLWPRTKSILMLWLVMFFKQKKKNNNNR